MAYAGFGSLLVVAVIPVGVTLPRRGRRSPVVAEKVLLGAGLSALARDIDGGPVSVSCSQRDELASVLPPQAAAGPVASGAPWTRLG
jgi:hypothetical protein